MNIIKPVHCIFVLIAYAQMLLINAYADVSVKLDVYSFVRAFIYNHNVCMQTALLADAITVKTVLSGHSLIDKTMVVKTHRSLMKIESIAVCSLGAFCNTPDLH